MTEQDLTPTVHELMAQMSRMQAELNSLKERTHNLTPSEPPAKPVVSTTRRTALRRLAGGLMAGVGMVGIAAALPGQAEAKLTAKQGRIAVIVTQGSDTTTNDLPAGTFTYGLMGLSAAGTYDLTNFVNYPYPVGVVGYSSDSGVYGEGQFGVFGLGSLQGVTGQGNIANSIGVRGQVYTDGSIGVHGYTESATGIGVKGECTIANATSYAGYFEGKTHVNGVFSKSSGTFKIDHPLDPSNKYLYHSFVESPDMKNIYDGVVTLDQQGQATVELPAWFEALNSTYRYQLTCLGEYAPVFIAEEIKALKFKIAGGIAGQKVSWQVTGIRQDAWAKANPIKVEEDKTETEKGKYLHPTLFGQPKEKSVVPLTSPSTVPSKGLRRAK